MKKCTSLLFMLIFFCIAVTGCTSEREENCRFAIEDFLTKYQQLDPTAGAYVAEYVDSEQIQFNGIQAMIAERITYEIKDSEEHEEVCTVLVEISAPDFQAIFEDIAAEYTEIDTEEVILNNLKTKLDLPDVEMRSFTVEVNIRDADGAYQIEMTSELSNALFGGYYEYIDSLVEEMLNG